jgi:hypothetical protein
MVEMTAFEHHANSRKTVTTLMPHSGYLKVATQPICMILKRFFSLGSDAFTDHSP